MSVFGNAAPGNRATQAGSFAPAQAPAPPQPPAAPQAPSQQQAAWPAAQQRSDAQPHPMSNYDRGFGLPPAAPGALPAPAPSPFGGGAPMPPPPQQPQQPAFGGGGGSIFSKIDRNAFNTAKVYDQTIYEQPGRYLMRIDRVKEGVTRKQIPFVVVEQTVFAVFDQSGVPGHRVGEKVTHYMGADSDYFHSDMKKFIGGVVGRDKAAVTVEDCLEVVGPNQPLAGKFVHKNNTARPGKNPGVVFTSVSFEGMVSPEDAFSLTAEGDRPSMFPPA